MKMISSDNDNSLYQDIFGLQDKVVLITGASRGIGSEIAKLFSFYGVSLAINYNQSADAAMKLAEELKEITSKKVLPIQADVSNIHQVHRMVEDVVSEFGKVDILINNAGITKRGSVLELTEYDWDRVMEVNLKGTFLCTQSVVPHMLKGGGGSIVNMASMRGVAGSDRSMNYAASKAGVIALTKCLAIELAPKIRANCVAPGYVLTDIHEDKTKEQIFEISKKIPIARFASAREIATVVLFLASDAASYITGETIIISGGAVIQ